MTNNTIHMSPTRAFKFAQNPLRALEDYLGEIDWYESDDKTALFYGTIVHNIAEGRNMLDGLSEDEQGQLISTRGATKGHLKSGFVEAEIVGNHLRDYVKTLSDEPRFEVSLKEPNDLEVDGETYEFNVTGRADMLTDDTVYDFKTVANNEFDGFLKFGSFRDNREQNYIKQVAFYAHMFGKKKAHILYIQKNSKTPFIYDYQLSEQDLYDGWQDIANEIETAVQVIAQGKDKAKAVNDGSQWAFKYFGGVIYGNYNDEV